MTLKLWLKQAIKRRSKLTCKAPLDEKWYTYTFEYGLFKRLNSDIATFDPPMVSVDV